MRFCCLPNRRKHHYPFAHSLLLLGAASTAVFFVLISSPSFIPSSHFPLRSDKAIRTLAKSDWSADPPSDDVKIPNRSENATEEFGRPRDGAPCATVEKMGEAFASGPSHKESIRIRDVIHRHFSLHGASRVRGLPSDQFCQEGFVLGKASEAGFGNEMYKILSSAALSIMLNRSLIIGQTRGLYPFGGFVSYTNLSFTLKEVKHLWRKNDCAGKYGRRLTIRLDNFERPSETNILCSDWRIWKQPIIWLQGTTDAVAIQFFLKNINPGMRNAASTLFGDTRILKSRPNVFGELLRFIVTPSQEILEAINWVLNGKDPDIALHMRMLTNRSARAAKAALSCVKRALRNHDDLIANPRVVLISDTPSFIKEITPNLTEFADVLHFDYKMFESTISSWRIEENDRPADFRVKDWGPAPRWVTFVDFFLASRAKYAVISGAHRRVGTTYAQLIAALAEANSHGEDQMNRSFAFLSSFQSNLLTDGLANQIGWGHAWNRFAGSHSCRHQAGQCAFTSLLPPAWWDGEWQSPIPRDIRRLQAYGVHLTQAGRVVYDALEAHCQMRHDRVKTVPVFVT